MGTEARLLPVKTVERIDYDNLVILLKQKPTLFDCTEEEVKSIKNHFHHKRVPFRIRSMKVEGQGWMLTLASVGVPRTGRSTQT